MAYKAASIQEALEGAYAAELELERAGLVRCRPRIGRSSWLTRVRYSCIVLSGGNTMGYTIRIGATTPASDPDGFPVTVASVEVPVAPKDPWGGHSNARAPSYSAWHAFVQATGLEDLFHGRRGLMVNHPGIRPLRPAHLQALQKAETLYKKSFKRSEKPNAEHLERIQWLKFWMGWALDNCKHPSIYNG
jgi:hypothetical protein